MKYGSIAVAILLFIGLCSTVQSQSIQTNDLRERQTTHLPIVGTNVSQGISRGFLGAASKDRLHIGLATGIDSLRMKGLSSPFPIPNGFPRGTNLALAKLSNQSQISVIDTAMVRSTEDTTRHVYSFNAHAKRTSDLTQKLKGNLWADTRRETNTYDASNNMLSDLYEDWSNGQWVKTGYSPTYTYDANGHILSELFENWSNGQLAYSYRYRYTYDANGNRLSELHEELLNGQWVVSQRGTQTYDANGNMLSELYDTWSNGQWETDFRYSYTYDANGHLLSELYEDWSNGQWVGVYRSTYTYDANGHVLSELYEDWWIAQAHRFTWTYDANGNMLSWLHESWSNGQWVGVYRSTATYDANGNMLTGLTEDWSNYQWVNSYRRTITYDANGYMLTDLSEQWSTGQWVNSYRNTHTYDAQENLTSIWLYTWLNSSWTPTDYSDPKGRPFSVGIDSAGNNYGYYGYNFTFTRKLIVTGVAPQSGSVPSVYTLSQNYPNPFNPSTTIRYALPQRGDVSLVVFNTLGQQVATLVDGNQDTGSHEVHFDGSNQASGVYFYRLQAGNYTETKRFILLR